MTSKELQSQMLKHRMSIIDTAMALSITRSEVKKFANGQKEIPNWIDKFFEGLDAKT
jgi:plasmid maintenance system antidote protein VapI